MGNGLSNGATGYVGTAACQVGSTNCTTPVNGWTYAPGSPTGTYNISAQAGLDQSKAGSFTCSTTTWNSDYVSCSCSSGAACPTIGNVNTATTPMYCQASTSTTGPYACSGALPPKKTSPWVLAGIILAIFIVIMIIIVIIIALGRKNKKEEKALVMEDKTKEE